MPEIKRKNNNIRTRGILKKRDPLQLNFIGKLDNPKYTQINYLPILGYNQYNKFMLGCAFYNYSLLQRKTEITFAPMYAFEVKHQLGLQTLQDTLLKITISSSKLHLPEKPKHLPTIILILKHLMR